MRFLYRRDQLGMLGNIRKAFFWLSCRVAEIHGVKPPYNPHVHTTFDSLMQIKLILYWVAHMFIFWTTLDRGTGLTQSAVAVPILQ